MKRYLVRAGINPLAPIDILEIINSDLLGKNAGNLIYANSIFRSLMVDGDVEFVCDKYRLYSEDAGWINENFDSYIIPLADLFRPKNDREISRMKELIKKLNIPCVIIGVGIRAKSIKEIKNGFVFDDTAKEFINAVLDKSAMIGLRGEMTGQYLKRLGYIEGKDYMIIGCPSMYTYGNKLKTKELALNDDSIISVNESVLASKSAVSFLSKILNDYSNSYFLPQLSSEFWNLYMGKKYEFKQDRPTYPSSLDDEVFRENRVKAFLQAKQWMDFLSTADLSIGSRMHGNIAAILAGTPSIIIPHGTRMKELIDYHKLPHINPKELENCQGLNDVIEQVDFSGMHKCHAENFARYKEFLNINGIDTIFNDADYVENAPYDVALSKIGGDFEIKSANLITRRELAERWVGVRVENSGVKAEKRKHLKAALSEIEAEKSKSEASLKEIKSQKKRFKTELYVLTSRKSRLKRGLKLLIRKTGNSTRYYKKSQFKQFKGGEYE